MAIHRVVALEFLEFFAISIERLGVDVKPVALVLCNGLQLHMNGSPFNVLSDDFFGPGFIFPDPLIGTEIDF